MNKKRVDKEQQDSALNKSTDLRVIKNKATEGIELTKIVKRYTSSKSQLCDSFNH